MKDEAEIRKWRELEIQRLAAMVEEVDILVQLNTIYILSGVLDD